jgi:hypothetical protein
MFSLITFLNGINGIKPKMNALAERFVGSVHRESLDYYLLINEKQIKRIY